MLNEETGINNELLNKGFYLFLVCAAVSSETEVFEWFIYGDGNLIYLYT